MEPSADEEDAEIAPAASEQQQQEIEQREIISSEPAADEEGEELAAVIKQVLSLLKLLEAAGLRCITGDIERRCLAFMEMELRDIVASLKLSPPPLKNNDADINMLKWLQNLNGLVKTTKSFLEYQGCHTLLRRALQYKHLLLSSSDPGLPPQTAEAGGIPPVGIDRPTKKLLRWLTPMEETDRSLRVMFIVGPVGIGKTTLAMELHNRLTGAHYYFQCNLMAQASRRSDRNKLLLQDILSKISEPAAPAPSSDQSRLTTMDLLVRHVSEGLQDKRYFICIDDLWEASDWDEMKSAFPNNNLGSRLLITTRVGSTARSCCSDSEGLVHEMKPLNQVDSERLLLTRAFGSLHGGPPNSMKLFFDKILMRCEGIPLFINGMADWLEKQFQLQQADWLKEKFQLQRQEEEDEQLEQALSSAYYGLPYELRILSLYVSMFPYGYKFEKDRLIMKTVSEGLADGTLWSYEHADQWFFQLVDGNVITCVTANCKSNPDEAEACQWHINYFFQQFLASKAAEMGFAFTSATLNLAAASSTGHGNKTRILRRLALHDPDPLLPSLLKTIDLSQTRSLAVSGAVSGIPLHNFVNLVLLDLEGWDNLTDEDLLQVCRSKMFFLQYLSVRNTQVSKLPREIKELHSLEILDVGYTRISELPLELWATYLRVLDLRGTRIRKLPKQIVRLRFTLSTLLIGGEGMINSIETATRVPHDVQHLRYLRTLATIDLSEQPASFINALGGIRFLLVLAITWSFHQSTDRDYRKALLSSINEWRKLESLTIHCGLGCSMEFLGSLSDPPKKLEKFKVTAGRFANVPKWISMCNLLSFVQISVCKQETEDLKILRDLPKLQCLILGLDFIPGEAVVIENVGFPELQRFSVDCPMPWLSFSTGSMRKLTYLQLKFCATPASQTSVPSGITNLQRLTEVVLCYDEHYVNSPSVKMTVEAVKKEVAKHRNPIHLFINGTEDDVQAVDEETENATGTQSGSDAETKDDIQAVHEELVNAATEIQS